jgi:hypothetical protein
VKPKRLSYAQAATLQDVFLMLTPETSVELGVSDGNGGLRQIQVQPPTHDELMCILRFASCAAGSARERRALGIAMAALELVADGGDDDRGDRLAQAHAALAGEKMNEAQLRQSLLDTIALTRNARDFSEKAVDYFAGEIADSFAERFCRDERLPLELLRDVLLARKDVGGRGRRRKPDPRHALFKTLGLARISDKSLATECSRWIRSHPYSPRRRSRKVRSKTI